MLIKHSNSDNALRSLWDMITFIKDRFSNCVHQNHDAATILYISSLIISPIVAYKGKYLLNEIHSLVNLSPKNFICLVRTTAPSKFPGRMRSLQKKSIDFLRDKCYTVVFDPKREYLNHAKFLIFYHMCFSEGIIYHGKYFGSTNLTIAGLAYKISGRGSRNIGNYEEFSTIYPRPKLSLNKGDTFYLNEILDLINHKVSLYTDPNYLREYLLDHLTHIKSILRHSHRILSGTTLGELYETYIDLLIVHNQTYALLDEIPGKELTRELEEELTRIKPPMNPFELEIMIPTNVEQAELLAEDLGLRNVELQEKIRDYMDVMKKAHRLIEKRYLTVLEKIRDFFDAKEHSFMEFIERNNLYHKKSLRKIIKIVKVGESRKNVDY